MTAKVRAARALAIARRASELFPLTPLGAGLAGAAAFAFVIYGVRKVDLVLFAMAGVAIVVTALALLATTLTAAVLALRLRKRREAAGLRLECGLPTKTDFSLSSLWFVPLVSVEWSWAEPRAEVEAVARHGRLNETTIARRRGSYERVRRRIELSDAFRLTKITLIHDEPRAVHCLPSVGALKRMNVIRSLASGDSFPNPTSAAEGDRSDLRRYSPGDPVRFILWRVFAKTRQLVIKVPERAQSVATDAVAYLVAGEGDEAAAGAARMALESGALGTKWVFGVDGATGDAKTLDGALALIAASAGTPPPSSGAGLAAFLERHAKAGRVLVFVPAKEGAWLERAAQAVLRRASGGAAPNVEVLACCDGIDRSDEPGWLRRLTVAPPDGRSRGLEIVTLASSTAVLRTLARTRARVLLVDRAAGRFHEANEQLRLAKGTAPLEALAAPPTPTSTEPA
jgi:uncharacterized protein (DUF58 family)